MSVFGALNTAVSGLTAQSTAFTDISNNIANSQTVGYKATDTSFSDYVLNASSSTAVATTGTSDTVRANTTYQNQAQGTITSSTNALALAISGNGFFNVAEANGSSSTTSTSFQSDNYYTRDGDFTEDSQGYLVNSSNEYLKAYTVNSDGSVNTSSLNPINVSNVAFKPTETGTVTYAASLPGSTAESGTSSTTATTQTETIYDSSGAAHTASFTWTPVSGSTNSWTVSSSIDGSSATAASALVSFGSDGTMSSVAQQTNPGETPATYGTATTASGATASFSVPTGLSGDQTLTVKLGTIGSSSGTVMSTDAAGTGAAATVSTDSVTSGNYTGVSMTSDGDIMATFDNGESQLVGKIPLATFANANALTARDGQAYTATSSSGAAQESLANQNGAGSLETSSVEDSTTSLDTDLTRLITAQQAYGANAKVVTTANDMLQTVLAMKQ